MENVCIFCKKSDVPFTSVEHIFPESLGNQELVLPKGVVCDICNNGVLAKLDQILIEFPLVAIMKHFHGIKSKTGKIPNTKFVNIELKT